MTPFRRLALLAQDVQGPLKVERSVKMADQVDPRFLIMFPTSATNKALTIQFSERSGMDASGWSKSAEKSDHLGVCAAQSGSLRLYTQNLLNPARLYEGFKAYPDGSVRHDVYRQVQADQTDDISNLPTSSQNMVGEVLKRLNGAAFRDVIRCVIDSPERKSVLLQFEALGLRLSDFAAMDLGTILDGLREHRLNHLAMGQDDQDPSFLNLYFQSDARELQRVARNR